MHFHQPRHSARRFQVVYREEDVTIRDYVVMDPLDFVAGVVIETAAPGDRIAHEVDDLGDHHVYLQYNSIPGASLTTEYVWSES